MSINKIDANEGRLTLHGDHVLHHQDHIEFELEGDRLPANLRGCHKGDIFITNLRLIYINEGSSGYKSFSMDFQHIRNVEVKQPIFGANHLKGFIKAEPGGGWEGSANFKVNFPKGGAIDFAENFQKAVKDSLRNRHNGMVAPPPQQPAFYGPPICMMPPPEAYYYPLPQPAYYAYQPGAPPQAGQQPLYNPPTGQAPPPYMPTDQQTPAQTQQSSANAKAQEAYMTGHTAYIPNETPPPYNPNFDPNAKKDQ
ncbi:WW domain-binding protein 2-like [Hydractinia symbiolongicarpus]|uniref:WW domain-binding protein 2-like n=1 Tax=Hydractinia symbiolongicarpus TaxID=13093 RepID=UPI00254C54F9|nr:WW domain-binding protein 2-like [Hydractinia symbiolongicarpus]